MQLREKLARRAGKAGLLLPDTALAGFEEYFELLRKWNERISLTALPLDEVGDEAIDRLLIEPGLAARQLPNERANVIDIGSGGGSPAIPMKLVAPEISMLMVESKIRKAAFLREAVRCLRLTNTRVEAVRFEELLTRPELHESADVVTLRAVKVNQKTLAVVQSLLRVGGSLLLFTSVSSADVVPSPQLSRAASRVLLPQLGSRLQVLTKVF